MPQHDSFFIMAESASTAAAVAIIASTAVATEAAKDKKPDYNAAAAVATSTVAKERG